MRTASVLVVSVISLLASAAHAQTARWTVHSGNNVDARLKRQLQELASQEHRRIQFVRKVESSPVTDSAENLSINLNQLSDPATFAAELSHDAPDAAVHPAPVLAREGYFLRVNYDAKDHPRQLFITAESAVGFHNALLRLPVILTTERAQLATALIPRPQAVTAAKDGKVTIADFPSFPVRGVVEGFYGTPWSYQDRIDVLRFEGQHGMNIYFYGPKEDRYQRQLWRTPYPAKEMKHLAALAAIAKDNFVDFSFAVSPGLSIAYSSDTDFQTLTRKFDSVRRLGISNFALFLDDVPQELAHSADKQRFSTLAQAHIYLINRLNRYLKSISPDNRLTICPTTYTNEWGSREYIQELGAGVDPGISIDWTGTEVGGSPITVAQAREWAGYLHRKPLVWENFPNDDDKPWLPVFEPLRGMATELPSEIEGMFSNPLNQAHVALISLQTIADYLWNPGGYDPDASRDHAIRSQYGSDAFAYLEPLLKLYADNGSAASLFSTMFSAERSPIDVPAIRTQIQQLRASLDTLRRQPRFKTFAAELAPAPDLLDERLKLITADPGFLHLPDGRLQWNTSRDTLQATKIEAAPLLDGNFGKWRSTRFYTLNSREQLRDGDSWWSDASQFSAEVALRWDENKLYIGANVTDPRIYQPFTGRGIEEGDAIHLLIDTSTPRTDRFGRSADVYDLYLSPGDFATVSPSIYCKQDLFPQRPNPRDYKGEIGTFWKKTATGYSADIVIPATFFGRRKFTVGDTVALSFETQKAIPNGDPLLNDPDQIVFTSKTDRLFPIDPENPLTIQQVVLLDSAAQSSVEGTAKSDASVTQR